MGILPGYPRTFRHKSLILESLLDIDKITLEECENIQIKCFSFLLDIDKITPVNECKYPVSVLVFCWILINFRG